MTRTKALLVVVVLLALSAGYADVRVSQIGGSVARNQRSETRALCAFRQDIQRRYVSGVVFLRSHPHGFAGISEGVIRVSLMNERSTLESLSGLVC